jgi:hypothetical protein
VFYVLIKFGVAGEPIIREPGTAAALHDVHLDLKLGIEPVGINCYFTRYMYGWLQTLWDLHTILRIHGKYINPPSCFPIVLGIQLLK